MRRIGIFGGTFNPIHFGHLAAAQWVKEKIKLEKVIFVPCFLPPHKSESFVADARHRWRMLQLAAAGSPDFEVSDYEIKKKGASYTIETAQYFRQCFPPPAKLFFIVGQDSAAQLKTWKQIDALRRIVTFAVVNRFGYAKAVFPVKAVKVNTPIWEVSSSDIRRRVAAGLTVRYFVPPAVEKYIQRRGLYLSCSIGISRLPAPTSRNGGPGRRICLRHEKNSNT